MKPVKIKKKSPKKAINAYDDDEISDSEECVILAAREISFTIITTMLTSIYTLAWGIIFTMYIEVDEDSKDCSAKIVFWGRFTYVCLYLLAIMAFICCFLQIKKKNNLKIVQKILFIRTIINYVLAFFLVISMTVVYVKYCNINMCRKIGKIIFGFIVSEWFIVGSCIICFIIFVIVGFCCRAKREFWDGEGEVSFKELDKVY